MAELILIGRRFLEDADGGDDGLRRRRGAFTATPQAQGRTITPIGANAAARYSRLANAGPALYDPNADPGNTNAPIVFEPPAPLTAVQSVLWIVATGASPNWGGCNIYVSSDGNTYALAGSVHRGGRQGFVAVPLPSHADPDTADTLSVDLSESAGQLLSGTQADADNYVTLCYCGGEFISYQTADLTSAYHYDLSYLRRGVYGTPVMAHSVGSPFARIGPNEPSILQYQYPPSFIGGTIYLKFCSFNVFGGEVQSLADVGAYAYSLLGTGFSGSYEPPVVPPVVPPISQRQAVARALRDSESDDGDTWRRTLGIAGAAPS